MPLPALVRCNAERDALGLSGREFASAGIPGRQVQPSAAELRPFEKRQPLTAGQRKLAVADIGAVVDIETDTVALDEIAGAVLRHIRPCRSPGEGELQTAVAARSVEFGFLRGTGRKCHTAHTDTKPLENFLQIQ